MKIVAPYTQGLNFKWFLDLDKISDGIDHTALEGLVNLCDNDKSAEPEEEEPDESNDVEIDEEGTLEALCW